MTLADKERAASPDTAPRDLLSLARRHPREVLRNPILPLLSLEDVSLWRSIIFYAGSHLLIKELEASTQMQRRELAQQVKASSFSKLIDEVRAYQFETLRHNTMLAFQGYNTREKSWVETCALHLFCHDGASVQSRSRVIEAHLFETRGDEKLERPYYVVELWERTNNYRPIEDPILGTSEEQEVMHDRGELYVEVEQLMEMMSDCLLEELPWEELRAKYKNQELSQLSGCRSTTA